MRGNFEKLLGKTIKGVIIKQDNGSPQNQIFILFTDDTYFEIYGDDMRGARGLDVGGEEAIRAYMPDREIRSEHMDRTL